MQSASNTLGTLAPSHRLCVRDRELCQLRTPHECSRATTSQTVRLQANGAADKLVVVSSTPKTHNASALQNGQDKRPHSSATTKLPLAKVGYSYFTCCIVIITIRRLIRSSSRPTRRSKRSRLQLSAHTRHCFHTHSHYSRFLGTNFHSPSYTTVHNSPNQEPVRTICTSSV